MVNQLLPHGDYDHMGEAVNLVENFKVEKVIFNCGEFNELEQDLIEVLDKNKIPYYSCIKELNINDNKLYFLNNKDYDMRMIIHRLFIQNLIIINFYLWVMQE